MRRRTPSSDVPRRGHRLPTGRRRPALYLAVAAAGAVGVHVLTGAQPAAEAGTEPTSVAAELGLSDLSSAVDPAGDLRPLEELAASRATREDQQAAAQQVQAAADQAELDRRAAEATAAAQAAAAAEAAAAQAAVAQAASAAAASAAARPDDEVAAAVTSGTAATRVARISNTAGSVKPQVQAAADMVVSNVPGADEITLGGTRASATDPGGHPSGLALDYMVMSDEALGDAIVAYHRAHWDELGVEYLIYQQRMLSSPNGSWTPMEDRGTATANHMDHVHVNYR